MVKSEIARRPGCRSNIERITHVHQHHAQLTEFGREGQVILHSTAGGTRACFADLIAEQNPVQAIGLKADFPRCENVKKLSKLCCRSENMPKRCKLQW